VAPYIIIRNLKKRALPLAKDKIPVLLSVVSLIVNGRCLTAHIADDLRVEVNCALVSKL
jgi:hypothetical protein